MGGGITNSLPLNDVLNEANTKYRVTDVSDATNVVGAQMDIVPGLSPVSCVLVVLVCISCNGCIRLTKNLFKERWQLRVYVDDVQTQFI